MRTHVHRHSWLAAAVVLLWTPAGSAIAQTTPDPAGHWVGAIEAQGTEMGVEIDIAKTSAGFIGTISVPAQRQTGIPLQTIRIDGKNITFQARRDQVFSGAFSDDGSWIVGEFAIMTYKPPFSLQRSGPAHIEPALTSPRLTNDLVGHWTATVEASGQTLHLTLALLNQASGTALGMLVNEDEGGVQVPLTIEQKDRAVALTAPATDGHFSGTLNVEGTELAGTWTQPGLTLTVTFRRGATAAR